MTTAFLAVHPLASILVAFVLQAPPASAPPAKAPPPADPPSLDEALGIGGESKDRSAEQRSSDLQRSLDGAKPRDILASAIEDMRQSARLLEEKESGLPARRVQESVVRKLDELIASAQRMQQQQQQQQQSSSGQQQQQNKQSKGKSGQQQGDDGEREEPREDGQERGGRDGSKQDSNDGRRSKNAGESDADQPPPAVDATAQDAQFDEGRAEWGRLPPRVREAVRQGFRDPMSAAYRRLTQEYYRRLAEERKR